MLNRARLLCELQNVSQALFCDNLQEFALARESWKRIVADPLFAHKVRQVRSPWMIPKWQGCPGQAIAIAKAPQSYGVLSVDGSQVYPDRHQGVACYLINIGTVQLIYGNDSKPVTFDSQPFLFTGAENEQGIEGTPELVNCRRQEYEFQLGLKSALAFLESSKSALPYIFLFDGSLIFWHLESKELDLKELFLNKYLASLELFYQHKIPCAGYISMPKSKELVNLIRIELCKFELDGCETHHAVDTLVDASIGSFFLSEGMRSIAFESNAQIGAAYPAYLKPYFFYLDVGSEIARVEIPAWIAHDESLLAQAASLIYDQAQKGSGYPVALAEAHEQAVVKGPDREFFYHLITRLGIEQKQRVIVSQKSLKKRGMGI